MANVRIDKINIKIGEKEIELSLAEARELLDILDETLRPEPKEAPTKIVERIIERPYTYPWPYRTTYWSISNQSVASGATTTMYLAANNTGTISK